MISFFLRFEIGFVFNRIATQSNYVLDSEKVQINQEILRIFFRKASTKDVRNRIDLVFILDCRANPHRSRAFFYDFFL
ncbi:hypothetical protein D3C80_1760900 [compost metagenome]